MDMFGACGRATALAAVLALTGCGGGGSSGGGGSVSTAPTPTPGPSPSPSPSPSSSPTPTPTTASALTQADANIGECINLSNMLEAPNEGDYGRKFVDQDFADIAGQGFKTLRLPARFGNHVGSAPDYTIDPAFMARVEQAVTLARAAGLRVIIDNHFDDALMADPAGNTARFTAEWKQIAQRFRNADGMVWFELLNEPNNRLTNANLLSVYNPAIAAIRATNPTRPIVVGGQDYSSVRSLASLPVPDDAYIVFTFHEYDPFAFTHQGASFLDNPPPAGRAWTAADDAELAGNVRLAQDFLTRTGRPLFMGEYGTYEGVPLAERAKFYRSAHDQFGAAKINGCVWGYVNTFNFRENAVGGAWYQPLLDAIGL